MPSSEFPRTLLADGVVLKAMISFNHEEGDLDLYAFDITEVELDGSQGTADTEEVVIEATAEGFYFIMIEGWGYAVGAYTLMVEEADLCELDPCEIKMPVCSGDFQVIYSAPRCSVDATGAPVCEYLEQTTDCALLPTPTCEGNILFTALSGTCEVGDDFEPRCMTQTEQVDCTPAPDPVCDGSTLVEHLTGSCVPAGAHDPARCLVPEVRTDCTPPKPTACEGNNLVEHLGGSCVPATDVSPARCLVPEVRTDCTPPKPTACIGDNLVVYGQGSCVVQDGTAACIHPEAQVTDCRHVPSATCNDNILEAPTSGKCVLGEEAQPKCTYAVLQDDCTAAGQICRVDHCEYDCSPAGVWNNAWELTTTGGNPETVEGDAVEVFLEGEGVTQAFGISLDGLENWTGTVSNDPPDGFLYLFEGLMGDEPYSGSYLCEWDGGCSKAICEVQLPPFPDEQPELVGIATFLRRSTTVDWCRLQSPLDVVSPLEISDKLTVFGWFRAEGVTERSFGPDADPLLRAMVGYGPRGSEPADNDHWHWLPATGNHLFDSVGQGMPSVDEYMADLEFHAVGVYNFAYRFSLDQGETWTYCDRDARAAGGGDGSEDGYQTAQAGHVQVFDDACVPNPCNQPPGNRCNEQSPNVLETFSSPGGCTPDGAGFQCAYPPAERNCTAEGKLCIVDACTDDACTPNPCNQPPANHCRNGTLVTYSGQGQCTITDASQFDCNYPEIMVNCAEQGQLCAGAGATARCIDRCSPCDKQRLASCDEDGATLVTFGAQGQCAVVNDEAVCIYPEQGRIDCFANGQLCSAPTCDVVEGCPAGFGCVEGYCMTQGTPCGGGEACGVGEACIAGFCGRACGGVVGCSSGEVCIGGVCKGYAAATCVAPCPDPDPLDPDDERANPYTFHASGKRAGAICKADADQTDYIKVVVPAGYALVATMTKPAEVIDTISFYPVRNADFSGPFFNDSSMQLVFIPNSGNAELPIFLWVWNDTNTQDALYKVDIKIGALVGLWNFDASNANPNYGNEVATTGGGVAAPSWPTGFLYSSIDNVSKAWSWNTWSTLAAFDSTKGYFQFPLDFTGKRGIWCHFEEYRSATGIRKFEMRYSLDGGVNFNPMANSVTDRPDDTSWRQHLYDFSALAPSLDGKHALIRLYGYAAESVNGTWRVDDFACMADF